ncbi:hypothetical protein H4582DRAFT_2052925 [Lactarius indigo]|nr:hypothetical protein H4582DRAFT_2052925 [Lactarius indigo]
MINFVVITHAKAGYQAHSTQKKQCDATVLCSTSYTSSRLRENVCIPSALPNMAHPSEANQSFNLQLLIPTLLMMADNDEQCALMPNGTLKEPDKIIWYNDPDDAEPISAPGLGALSHIDSDASTLAGLKGKEPAQHVGSRCIIKPTIKAQQASLTGFFSTRTVLIDGKESAQKSSTDSGPSKQV